MITTLTDLLELVGLLFLLAAVMVLLWPVSVALALAVAGGILLGSSWLVLRVARRRKRASS